MAKSAKHTTGVPKFSKAAFDYYAKSLRMHMGDQSVLKLMIDGKHISPSREVIFEMFDRDQFINEFIGGRKMGTSAAEPLKMSNSGFGASCLSPVIRYKGTYSSYDIDRAMVEFLGDVAEATEAKKSSISIGGVKIKFDKKVDYTEVAGLRYNMVFRNWVSERLADYADADIDLIYAQRMAEDASARATLARHVFETVDEKDTRYIDDCGDDGEQMFAALLL